jgi:adenine phosphoribosyltransferase
MKEGSSMEELKSILRTIPDFPKKGINFVDITTLVIDADALKKVIDHFSERYKGKGINKIIGIESRGFIFAPAVAANIGAGFVPVRKPGKLPADTISIEYELEYGTDTLEIHKDALSGGDRILIIDDLIATGGTAAAVATLVKDLGAELVELAFVVELTFLEPRKKLPGLPVYSLVTY